MDRGAQSHGQADRHHLRHARRSDAGPRRARGGPSGGFEYGGWQAPYGDEETGEFILDVFGRAEAFLLGRRTYEIFAGYWPQHDDPANPVASRLNRLPKYVATASLKEPAEWEATTFVDGEHLQSEIVRIKDAMAGSSRSGAAARWRSGCWRGTWWRS